MTYQPY